MEKSKAEGGEQSTVNSRQLKVESEDAWRTSTGKTRCRDPVWVNATGADGAPRGLVKFSFGISVDKTSHKIPVTRI